VTAKAALDRDTHSLQARFKLADAWSDAGCFDDALQILQGAPASQPPNQELQTRLRVAKSLVGEEHFFDNIDRADFDAKLKRNVFRCATLGDLDACGNAVRMKPDDPILLTSEGDALLQAKRPADAIARYRRAVQIAPNQYDIAMKIDAAETQLGAAHSNPPVVATDGEAASMPRSIAAGTRNPARHKVHFSRARKNPEPAPRYSNEESGTRSH